MKASNSLASIGSLRRNAQRNAPRSTALTAHFRCTHAPLPGKLRCGSGRTLPETHTTRSKACGFARFRQSIQLRMNLLVFLAGLMQGFQDYLIAQIQRANLTCPFLNSLNCCPNRQHHSVSTALGGGMWSIGVDVDPPPC